jgi:predicted transposase YdaD
MIHLPADHHPVRRELIDGFFEFHPAMTKYANERYFSKIHGSRETVSVHFRLATEDEPNPDGLSRRGHASASWYLHLMEKEFDPAKVVYFVFSEDSRIVQPMFMNMRARNPAMQFVIIDEDFATSLAVMTMCKHHIMSFSTFSFWGMQMLVFCMAHAN